MESRMTTISRSGYTLEIQGLMGSVVVAVPGGRSVALVSGITNKIAVLMGIPLNAHLITWIQIQGKVLGGPEGTYESHRPSMFVVGTEVRSRWVQARLGHDTASNLTIDTMARGLSDLLTILHEQAT